MAARTVLWLMIAATVSAAVSAVTAQAPQASPGQAVDAPYQTIFYKSGSLRLEAYLYKPSGDGPFPLIVYNHGTRDGQDRVEQPVPFVGRVLTRVGYAVLVPERRGYGKSDGRILRDEMGSDLAGRLLNRLHEETSDALAAFDDVKRDRSIDTSRVGIMGWSFGGIISIFAAKNNPVFFAIVDQAGGALTWNQSPALQSALRDAAGGLRAPVLCMDAENDATTEAARSVCEAARTHGIPAELKIYPAFTPTQNPNRVAPGHLIFSGQGVSIWGRDVTTFFNTHRPSP